jgi:hypothetical protein
MIFDHWTSLNPHHRNLMASHLLSMLVSFNWRRSIENRIRFNSEYLFHRIWSSYSFLHHSCTMWVNFRSPLCNIFTRLACTNKFEDVQYWNDSAYSNRFHSIAATDRRFSKFIALNRWSQEMRNVTNHAWYNRYVLNIT